MAAKCVSSCALGLALHLVGAVHVKDEGVARQVLEPAPLDGKDQQVPLMAMATAKDASGESSGTHAALWSAAYKKKFGKEAVTDVCDEYKQCDSVAHTCLATVDKMPMAPFKMRVFEHDKYVSRAALCEHKVWEDGGVTEMIDRLSPLSKGSFLDIGANIGSWAVPIGASMQARGSKGVVIAAEAMTASLDLIKDSVQLNSLKNFQFVNKAVVQNSDKKPSICINIEDVAPAEETNMGGNMAELGQRKTNDSPCKKEVPTTTLDYLYEQIPEMKDIAAVKLDCEGCEGQALLGGNKFLTEKPPCYLAFELTEDYLCQAGTNPTELKEFLEAKGYDTSSMQLHGGSTCAEYMEWAKKNEHPQTFATLPLKKLDECLARFTDKSSAAAAIPAAARPQVPAVPPATAAGPATAAVAEPATTAVPAASSASVPAASAAATTATSEPAGTAAATLAAAPAAAQAEPSLAARSLAGRPQTSTCLAALSFIYLSHSLLSYS
jgi:FkbM family methyltransferase